ncbi:MAG TPA: calcium-binding protein [Solirubrobacterales bacterium]|nr:calcium-binding protein [Solirubrobacterales bacterium]
MLAAALALIFSCPDAIPQERLVLRGPSAGSHVRLGRVGELLSIEGRISGARPAGCRPSGNGHGVVCPLGDVGGIELSMGPQGDLVEVMDKLPIPLTVRLGDGSDKFIGSGEPDTCYPEGARRNRCIGGGGDDICITGNRNSDCVGDRGDDYCQTGAGSDGCWGGPGDDVCRMGAGEDGCHGEGGNDRLYGGPNPDQLYGGRGYDFCDGLPGRGRSHGCEAGPGR